MDFNPLPGRVMHIDINSCFATIEQQANPLLRGRPVVVAAYTTPNGCILAASREAKCFGIKTGMRVAEGKLFYPRLIVLPSDPWKYRSVHLKLRKLISDYTEDFVPKSIDEFVLNLEGYPCLLSQSMTGIAKEIKSKVKDKIGEWITVSIGIAPNRYLAKVAAGLQKPDGLSEINRQNYMEIYKKMKLTDLTGIKEGNCIRLNSVGIYTVPDFYSAPVWKLKAAFHSINGLYWHTRLSGYEIDSVEFGRRSYGNSVALGVMVTKKEEITPILSNLVEKTSARMRAAGYIARGVHLLLAYRDGSSWHRGELVKKDLFDSRDVFAQALRILSRHPFEKPVRNIAVSVFDLRRAGPLQLDFFDNVERKETTMKAVDAINKRWGEFVVKPGRMLAAKQQILDRIAFGGIKEL